MGETADGLNELIRRASAGDRSSLESLLIHYHDPLMRFVRRSVPPSASAITSPEDLFQETLIQAFRSIQTIEPHGGTAFFAWLKTIARTRLINRLKAHRAKKRGGGKRAAIGKNTFDPTATSILNVIASQEPGSATIVRRREAADAIAKVLAELNPAKRLVLDLRYRKQMSIADIAAKVGKGEGAVKMIINRSIKELRDRLDNLGEFTVGL